MAKFTFTKKSGKWDYEGRPSFTTQTQKDMKVQKGQHRRHIVSSHLLLQALAAYLNAVNNDNKISGIVDTFIQKHGVNVAGTAALAAKLEKVAQFIHNNPRNLFPERGDENTTIGFLPKDISRSVKESDKIYHEQLHKHEHIFTCNISAIINLLQSLEALKTKGFAFCKVFKEQTLQEVIQMIEVSVQQNPNISYFQIRQFVLCDINLSFELDLNKKEGMKTQNSEVIQIFKDLDNLANSGHGDFFQIAEKLLSLSSS